ncbi:GDSL esterase/lipase At1g71691-like [Zingiber officinale]|uniref:GDSL esterase/lipase At1g71691-like n=1 Tax=Zingiber officinale TaxID=94328 RepID=UPI001C4B147B|nr:GDSL esterase/lipase At1g71691-like [Zingiber officinale]
MEKLQQAATIFLFLSLISFLANLSTAAAATSRAVFVFGDSTVDVGNNNFLPSDAPKANFHPYGVDFPGRIPTGRFGNGFLGVDFVAHAAGIHRSPPPFLSLRNGDHGRRGVNFASAGSGVLDTTGTDVVTMTQQIKDFSTFAGNLRASKGDRSAAFFLRKSLFYVSVGSNDLFAFSTVLIPGNSTQKDEIVAAVLGQFAGQLRSIYQLGARKFAVPGTGQLGCIPGVRSRVPGGACNPELNDLSLRYKTATRALLDQLAVELKGFRFSFSDFFEIGSQIQSDPQKYGFTELAVPCCGLDAEGRCTPNSTYCSHRNQYFFWDAVHPSQAVYRLGARLSFYGPCQFAYPVNIHSLLEN